MDKEQIGLGDTTRQWNDDGDIVKTSQNITPVLDYVKEAQLEGGGWTESRDMKLSYEVPMVVVHELKTKYKLDIYKEDDLPAIKRVLDTHYALLKV